MALDLVTQLFIDGAWTTCAGYSESGWRVRIGPDVETGYQPSSFSMTLNNDDLSMDPSNVSSPNHGKIGRNTRARIRINSTTLMWGEAASWQPDATIDHVPGAGRGRAWVDLTAEGLLRRLGRWTEPIESPLRRYTSSHSNLIGYWPLEDPSTATTLEQVVPGAAVGSFSGSVSLAGSDGAGGSGSSVEINSGSRLRGRFAASGASGFQVSWATQLAAVPSSGTHMPLITWTDSTGRTWMFMVSNTQFAFYVFDQDGLLLKSSAVSFGVTPVTSWIRYRVKVTVSGSTITVEPAWYTQDASILTGWTDTFAGTRTGQPRDWWIDGDTYTDGAGYGHVFAVANASLDLLTGDALSAFNGFLSERAGARFQRLLAEQGLSSYLASPVGAADTPPMGRQKPATLLDLLAECVITDGGLLYDTPGDIALTMRTRADMVNRTPALALTKADVVAPLRKVIDDVGTVNHVTVTNADGSAAVAQLATGALSTALPPAGAGLIKGGVEVNLADPSALADRANWEMRKGTLDRPRYLAVTLDLFKFPALANTVTAMRPGDWISLAGVEPDTIYLRVISTERAGDAVRDTVTFACLPAELFQVAKIDAAASRIDSSSTTLGGSLTTTATTITISTANPREVWATAGGYDLKIGGERIGVPAAGMGAVTGTGPYQQVITGAVRSKNGVVKTHTAGAEVHLADPVRIGL
jgi:hypothetical protein